MNKVGFIAGLTTALALTSTAPQTAALEVWADKYLAELRQKAQELLQPPFSLAELEQVADVAVKAAQDLKGIFYGVPRAVIAQTALVAAVKTVLPATAAPWVLPWLEGPTLAALIESSFQRLFGPAADTSAAPVVDASDVAEGGVQ
ncbi:hypothetical protein [uncultured Deinococcus sp.]|uniref:hypothetical protein n=1 Tax=uncultured Deinococcus sp. TaxID=158789 RepID=UPI002588530B|nr:hypothetical protein [uncultured Deinococcus sp.]